MQVVNSQRLARFGHSIVGRLNGGPRVARSDLTDAEWAVVEPLLPTDVRGKDRVDDRRVLNGIFWATTHGRALSRHPGTLRAVHTCGNHFRCWSSGIGFWRQFPKPMRVTCTLTACGYTGMRPVPKKMVDPVAWVAREAA
ncbi:transposase [Methylobacterium sp. WL122]|nr:transposase [Methylobacterium sp. WL122]